MLFKMMDKDRKGVVSYNELSQMVYKDEAVAQVRTHCTFYYTDATLAGNRRACRVSTVPLSSYCVGGRC